jgi:hypothetical protein
VTALEAQQRLTLVQVKSKLADEMRKREMNKVIGTNPNSNSKSSFNTQAKRRLKCSNCNKSGHSKDTCWAPGGDKEGEGPKQKGEKGKKGGANTAKTPSAFHAEAVNKRDQKEANNTTKGEESEWLFDPGATDHMVNNKNWF